MVKLFVTRRLPLCTLFILSKLSPAAAFCIAHNCRPLSLRQNQATSHLFSFNSFSPNSQRRILLSQTTRFSITRRNTVSMATTRLEFGSSASSVVTSSVIAVGKKEALQSDDFLPHLGQLDKGLRDQMLSDASPGTAGTSVSTYVPATSPGSKPTKVVLAVLPSKASRHNSAFQPHAITSLVSGAVGGTGDVRIVVALEEDWQVAPAACALARAFPLYNRKQAKPPPAVEGGDAAAAEASDRTIAVSFVVSGGGAGGGKVTDEKRLAAAATAAEAVRRAGRLVDTPPAEMDTEAMVAEARATAERLGAGVKCEVIAGRELEARGYGGLWGVGKAAERAPALVILSYEPPAGGASPETVCLVGKGIIYDTGGLSLKISGAMVGMKTDMGGAAAMLSTFECAVKLGVKRRLHALLCLAENAIGPGAFRNDDILCCYSGKCVEINNTDAEGRLVLADGVAHASKHLKPDLIVDMATLTGAQGISTGKRHAAILANSADLETRAIAAGLRSGDLVHPLPYCPEFFLEEFKSKVADMRNSVKDRSNAQSSCAGHFIEAHLDPAYAGGWLHVDMAFPAVKDERGTGYGVALLLSLLEVPGFS